MAGASSPSRNWKRLAFRSSTAPIGSGSSMASLRDRWGPLLTQTQADKLLVVAEVELAVGEGRVRPGRPADLRSGQLTVRLRAGIDQNEIASIFEHQDLPVSCA